MLIAIILSAILLLNVCVCQDCVGYRIITNTSDECECLKTVSATAYRAGLPVSVILTDDVTSSVIDGVCIGCYTDPDNNFGSMLTTNANFSDEAQVCSEGVQSSFFTSDTPAGTADETGISFSIGGDACMPDYATPFEPVSAPVPAPEPTSVPAPEPTIGPTLEPTSVPAPEPTIGPTLEPTFVPAPGPTIVQTPDSTSVSALELAPAPQQGTKCIPSIFFVVFMLVALIFGEAFGQQQTATVYVTKTEGACSPGPAPSDNAAVAPTNDAVPVDNPNNGGNGGGGNTVSDNTIPFAISNAMITSMPVIRTGYGE